MAPETEDETKDADNSMAKLEPRAMYFCAQGLGPQRENGWLITGSLDDPFEAATYWGQVSSALWPSQQAHQWQVKATDSDEWHVAADVTLISGAALGPLSLSGQRDGETDADCMGRYTLCPESIAGRRPVYRLDSEHGPDRRLYCHDGIWFVAQPDEAEKCTGNGVWCVEQNVVTPDLITPDAKNPWQVYNGGEWINVTAVKMVSDFIVPRGLPRPPTPPKVDEGIDLEDEEKTGHEKKLSRTLSADFGMELSGSDDFDEDDDNEDDEEGLTVEEEDDGGGESLLGIGGMDASYDLLFKKGQRRKNWLKRYFEILFEPPMNEADAAGGAAGENRHLTVGGDAWTAAMSAARAQSAGWTSTAPAARA